MDTPPSSEPAPARPRVVDVAALLVLAAAGLNAVIGVLVAVTAATSGVEVPPALVAVVVAISVLFAVAIAVFVLLFRAGRTWARAVLVGLSAAALLTLFAPNALNLAVILLLVVGCALLYRRPVDAWVRELRDRRTVSGRARPGVEGA